MNCFTAKLDIITSFFRTPVVSRGSRTTFHQTLLLSHQQHIEEVQ